MGVTNGITYKIFLGTTLYHKPCTVFIKSQANYTLQQVSTGIAKRVHIEPGRQKTWSFNAEYISFKANKLIPL